MNKIIICSLLILLLPLVSGHLAGGEDLTKDGYLIDFGFEPSPIKEKEKVTLAFNLLNADTFEVIEPSRVWIRISNKDNVVFAGNMAPQAQHIAYTYTFPKGGYYTIDTRFFAGDELLVEQDFKINVESTKRSKSKSFYVVKFLILLTIIGLIYWYVKKKKR